MSWNGLILAPTKASGDQARRALGLHGWLVTTPDGLFDLAQHQAPCQPRILAVDHPGHEPMSIAITRHSHRLVDICGGVKPDVWHLRRSR